MKKDKTRDRSKSRFEKDIKIKKTFKDNKDGKYKQKFYGEEDED